MKHLCLQKFVVIIVCLNLSTIAHAGMIFTDQTAFNNAISGSSILWQEDFNSFAIGPVNPLVIGGGSAQLVSSSDGQAVSNVFGTSNGSLNSGVNDVTVAGLVGPNFPLVGVGALSLFYTNNSGEWQFIFGETASEVDVISVPTISPQTGPTEFIGWIADPGEQLLLARFSPDGAGGVGGIFIDDITAYSVAPVPLPAGLWLMSSGLVFLLGWRAQKNGVKLD